MTNGTRAQPSIPPAATTPPNPAGATATHQRNVDAESNGAAASASVELRIIGMTCGACVQRVQTALRRAGDVSEAGVNLMSETALVRGPAAADPSRLIDAVRRAGYDAELLRRGAAAETPHSLDAGQRENLRRHRQAMIQAVGLALPIILLDHFGHALQAGHAAGQLGWRMLQAALTFMLILSPAGAPILAGGVRAALHRAPNMDLLITTGVAAAVFSSLAGTLALRPEFIHFHAAAMILMLVSIGRWLEAAARAKAASAMGLLARRIPRRARVQREGRYVEIAADEVLAGDRVQVPTQQPIPTDGVVIEGPVGVDESLMTGEPLPVTRAPGDAVLGGTIVVEGMLTYRATQVGQASAVGRIVELVRRAQASPTRMQRLADQVAGIFTPIVIVLSLLTFAGWLVWGGPARVSGGLSAAIAVLVVACPCAMGLATPTAVLVASSQAALRGILVRDAATLEAFGRVRTVVWDKTGTLTGGRPAVVAVRALDATTNPAANDQGSSTADAMLQLAAAAEQFSQHPLAVGLVAEARRRGLHVPDPDSFETVIGGGVRASVGGRRVIVGSERFLSECGVDTAPFAPLIQGEERQARSMCLVAIEERPGGAISPAGVIALEDPPRPSAADAVERLSRLGIRSIMLTGDSAATAEAIAARVGIREVRAAASPRDKLEFVADLKHRAGPVAMIGDGVNDAAALAAADVGVAFATGADVAAAAAGVNLVGSTPHLVADAVELARAGVRIIRQNLFWAFFYNVLMLPLAAFGVLPPGIAAGAMMLSSLTVVLNALRLRIAPRAI